MTHRIVAVSAGIGVPSSTRLLTDSILGAVRSQAAARGEAVETSVIEVRDLATGLAATLVGGRPTPEVEQAVATVAAASGLVAVTPVFAAGYSGLFKLFFDVLDMSEPGAVAGTPVLVAATAGTPRHSLVLDHALRPLFTYLRAVVVPTGVFAATEDFGAGAGGRDLGERTSRAASELVGLVVADTGPGRAVAGFVPTEADRSRARASGTPEVTPFEDLLRGHTG